MAIINNNGRKQSYSIVVTSSDLSGRLYYGIPLWHTHLREQLPFQK